MRLFPWVLFQMPVKALQYVVWAVMMAVPLVHAAPRVEALGLMRDAAVLRINGQQHFLRVGGQSPEGVRLIRADSERAEVEFSGQRVTLNLSRQVSATFSEPELRSLVVARDPQGQYRVQGSINQQPVEFLVDTGATAIGMNAAQARRLGIDYQVIGEPGMVTTASGAVQGYSVRLDRVKVGEIAVPNVRATVIEGDYPRLVLLGMTFLSQVDWQESNGRLELRSKY